MNLPTLPELRAIADLSALNARGHADNIADLVVRKKRNPDDLERARQRQRDAEAIAEYFRRVNGEGRA